MNFHLGMAYREHKKSNVNRKPTRPLAAVGNDVKWPHHKVPSCQPSCNSNARVGVMLLNDMLPAPPPSHLLA